MPWLRPDPARQTAEQLYAALVAQARCPEFYSALRVPDTLDGRFELVALHMFLALRRLKLDASAADTRQALGPRCRTAGQGHGAGPLRTHRRL
jgi:cytochrome b pre-mRNA-processing protein 3